MLLCNLLCDIKFHDPSGRSTFGLLSSQFTISAIDRSILAAGVGSPRNFKSQYPFKNHSLSEIVGYVCVGTLQNELRQKSRTMLTMAFPSEGT